MNEDRFTLIWINRMGRSVSRETCCVCYKRQPEPGNLYYGDVRPWMRRPILSSPCASVYCKPANKPQNAMVIIEGHVIPLRDGDKIEGYRRAGSWIRSNNKERGSICNGEISPF